METDAQAVDRRVVFILSETRSGSTWLSYVLGSHADAVHLGEYYRPFTMPGHVACRLCEARGRTECEYLDGIEQVAIEDAYNFAFDRFGKPVLVDCSKQLDWLDRHAESDAFEVKVIHLLRDPRAWYASEKRRNEALSVDDAMTSWVDTNACIGRFLQDRSLSHTTAFYDELCLRPEVYLAGDVSSYTGLPFEEDALDYWKKPHHGLGGNGAALSNLAGLGRAQVETGDDEYYRKLSRKRFYDSRWLEDLDTVERTAIEGARIVNDYLGIHGRDFAHFDKLSGDADGG